MFDFYYNHVKECWPASQSRVLYTDTDSLVIELEHHGDLHESLALFNRYYDCLDFSETVNPDAKVAYASVQDINHNAGILGKFKDEKFGWNILSGRFLRPKMYSIVTDDPETHPDTTKHVGHVLHAKGVPGKATVPRSEEKIAKNLEALAMNMVEDRASQFNATRRKLNHDDFVRVLDGEMGRGVEYVKFRHDPATLGWGDRHNPAQHKKGHSIYQLRTSREAKRGLSNADDKSYYFDASTCLRYGHPDIKD